MTTEAPAIARVPRIDAHQHFWSYHAPDFPWIDATERLLARDFLPGDLLPSLQGGGFDGCIAVQARPQPGETDFLLDLAAAHGCIAAVVGWVELRSGEVEKQLERWDGAARLKGMRHMLQDEASPQDVLASPVFRRNVAVLQARGLVYEILIRSGQFAGVAEFCASLDRHILVLDHLGKPPVRDRSAAAFASWRAALHEVAALPHVLCKLSGLLTEAKPGDSLAPDDFHRYFDAVLECFGPRRLIFGSDWPVCLLARPYCETASLAEEWSRRLSPKEYDAFWGGNAQSCYAII